MVGGLIELVVVRMPDLDILILSAHHVVYFTFHAMVIRTWSWRLEGNTVYPCWTWTEYCWVWDLLFGLLHQIFSQIILTYSWIGIHISGGILGWYHHHILGIGLLYYVVLTRARNAFGITFPLESRLSTVKTLVLEGFLFQFAELILSTYNKDLWKLFLSVIKPRWRYHGLANFSLFTMKK